jgi:5,10-methylene-tetrahydrofolate dehydrogenase/methenyl tetrahydrofolate cyclohydrolase
MEIKEKYSIPTTKLLHVSSLINKYDEPVWACNRGLYEQYGIKPSLAVILTNSDPGSVSYTRGIKRFCTHHNIICKDYRTNNADELNELIDKLNNDTEIHGIMIMYPTGYELKDTQFMNRVSPAKDIEGLSYSYLGYLVQSEKYSDYEQIKKLVIPPTAKGIISVLKRYYLDYEDFYKMRGFYPENIESNLFDIEGKRVTIINDSLAVGRSLALMFLNEHASVEVYHKYTTFKTIVSSVSHSDIIISAVPSGKFIIPTDTIPKNTILFDISFEGNFDYPSVLDKCFKIAARWDLVPKGDRINDMTLNRLISNLHYLIKAQLPDTALKDLQDSIL